MCQAKKTLQASILLIVGMLAFVSLTWSSTPSSVAKSAQLELWPWQQSIQKINAARERGEISADTAALYRLTAIQDPHQLPEKFQPDSFDVNQSLPTDGMMELAEKLEALFADKAHWQTTTFQTINEALLAAPHEQTLAANTNLIWYTPHFAIHWSDTGPNAPPYPNPSDYVKVISDTLESAWDALSSYGYTMPNPSDFGGQTRFNRLYRK